MATPTPEPNKNRGRLQLSEVLTIDDLINLVLTRARSRRGRFVVTAMGLLVVTAIVFVPIVRRSGHPAAPSSTPTVPIVTDPPTTEGLTTRVVPLLPVIDTRIGKERYGAKPPVPTTVPTSTATTAATTPATFPPLTAGAPVTAPPATAGPPATAAKPVAPPPTQAPVL